MANTIKVPEYNLEVDSRDKKYYIEKPDPSFSPERNMAIVYETLEESNQFLTQINKVFRDDGDNRVDVLSSYSKYLFSKHGSKDFESYAGRQLYTKLVGEKILNKVKVMSIAERLKKK